MLKLLPVTVLRPLADLDTGGEYPDIIYRQKDSASVYPAILEALMAHKNQWDIIWMPRMRSWQVTCLASHALPRQQGVLSVRQRQHSFSATELPQNKALFKKQLPRRKQRSNQRNRILKTAGISFERCQNQADIKHYLSALFALHQQRWLQTGCDGVFIRKPAEAEFYRRFVPHALEQGWLRFHAIKQDGEIKAIQLGYVYQDHYHILQEGFAPDFMPGVGGVLRWLVIDECIDQGIKTYDFLGQHTAHKASWQAKERLGSDIIIGHDRPLSRLIQDAKIWPTGRYLRPVIRTL